MPSLMVNMTLLEMLLSNPKIILYDSTCDANTDSIIDSILDSNRDAKIDTKSMLSRLYTRLKNGIYKRCYYEFIEDALKTL